MKKMKLLDLEVNDIDSMWDDITHAWSEAGALYFEMMLDLDNGDKLDHNKRQALADGLDRLRHKIEVFRSETDV